MAKVKLKERKRPGSPFLDILYKSRKVGLLSTRANPPRIDWLPSRASGVDLNHAEKREVMIGASQELSARLVESRKHQQGIEGEPAEVDTEHRTIILPEGFDDDGADERTDPGGEDAPAGEG